MEFNWFSHLRCEADVGTPIINSLSDLYSQMRFLHFSGGFSEQEIFNRLITRPLRYGDPSAAKVLQMLVGGTCLRRRKDMKFRGKRIVELPGVDEYLHKIGIPPMVKPNKTFLRKNARNIWFWRKRRRASWIKSIMVRRKDTRLSLNCSCE